MSGSVGSSYLRSQHGALGLGKRPSELAKPATTAATGDRLLTTEQAADLLGYSPDAFRSLVHAGWIKRVGSRRIWRFRQSDVERLRGER